MRGRERKQIFERGRWKKTNKKEWQRTQRKGRMKREKREYEGR